MPPLRAQLYKKILKTLLEEGVPQRGLGEMLRQEGGRTKADLRKISEEALKGIKTVKETPSIRPELLGYMDKNLGELGINPKAILTTKTPIIPHEIYHNIALRGGTEESAEEFARALRARVKGKSLEDIPKKFHPWILGLTGALGGTMAASELTQPSEAEASPIGKLVSKVVSGPASSAARRLIGHEISGMKIKNVIKGKEPWRYITFEGTDQVIPVTKDVVNDLARQFGEEMYTGIAEAKPASEALKMAIKSAERRLDLKGTGSYTKEELIAMEAKHVNVLQALELQRKKQVDIIYRGERICIPEVYADILEKFNLAKRVKGK